MKKEHRIIFNKQQIESSIWSDQNIIDAAIKSNIIVSSPCGGKGICNKCLIKLVSGKVSGDIFIKPDIYLACQTIPLSDCVVEIINTDEDFIFTKQDLISNINIEYKYNKSIFKTCINLPEETIDDNTPYYQRILGLLSDKLLEFTDSESQISLNQLQHIPEILDKNNREITVTTDLSNNIIHLESGNIANTNYGLAIDLGTTTIDILLIDLNTGQVKSNKSIYNAQRKYGADIISRIIYSNKNKALKEIQSSAIESINKIIESFQNELSLDYNNIYKVIISGNTTMTHFLLGVDPDSIRISPYTPVFSKVNSFKARQIGLKSNINSDLKVFPCISSYVGGDITAGILSSQLYTSDTIKLLIDIGTNGEIVLGNSEWMLSCSCSAGPAFEGANISSGTRARSGAIQSILINSDTLEPEFTTIDNNQPCGLCGSAIIDLIAEMLKSNIINRQGKINRSIISNRIRPGGNVYEYVIVFKEDHKLDRDITINENDIMNVIRAKGAIFSGITMLLKSVDMTYSDVDKILLAGSFGKHINFNNAIKIGLMPDLDIEKFEYCGNLSLLGSYKYLCNEEEKSNIDYISSNVTYLELSENQEFMSLYTASLFLPHTDMSLFSSERSN